MPDGGQWADSLKMMDVHEVVHARRRDVHCVYIILK